MRWLWILVLCCGCRSPVTGRLQPLEVHHRPAAIVLLPQRVTNNTVLMPQAIPELWQVRYEVVRADGKHDEVWCSVTEAEYREAEQLIGR